MIWALLHALANPAQWAIKFEDGVIVLEPLASLKSDQIKGAK